MKNYLRFLWVRYRVRIVSIAVFLTLFTAINGYFSVKNSFVSFNSTRAVAYLKKEKPELVDKYIEAGNLQKEISGDISGGTPEQREFINSRKDEYDREYNRIEDELNATNKKITKQDIVDIRNSFSIESASHGFNYMSAIRQLKNRDKMKPYSSSFLDLRDYSESPELIKEKLDSRVDEVRAIGPEAPGEPNTVIFMLFIFIFFVVGSITSLESMSRYKYFEESLPISNVKKYLAKGIFAILSSLIFFSIQISIVLMVQKISPYSEVIDSLGLLTTSAEYLVIAAGLTLLILFIGNYCGNFISYIGTVLFTIGNPIALLMSTASIKRLFPEILADIFIMGMNSAMDRLSNLVLIPMDIAYRALFPTLIWIVFIVAITVLGMFISKHTKTERSGMFYTVEKIDKIYYILLIILTAQIPLRLVNSITRFSDITLDIGGLILNWIIYIISMVGLSRLYKYFFEAKFYI